MIPIIFGREFILMEYDYLIKMIGLYLSAPSGSKVGLFLQNASFFGFTQRGKGAAKSRKAFAAPAF